MNMLPKPPQGKKIEKEKWPEWAKKGDGESEEDFLNLLNTHISNYNQAHLYEDEGEDEDYAGLLYRLVMVDGQPYMEVVENE